MGTNDVKVCPRFKLVCDTCLIHTLSVWRSILGTNGVKVYPRFRLVCDICFTRTQSGGLFSVQMVSRFILALGQYMIHASHVLSLVIVQELCESRGGRPGLSVLTSLLVSVGVKNY